MAKEASIRAFKCPSCGAPLEPEVGTLTMKCPYCGGTVIIPESLRTRPPSAGPTLNEAFQFGLNGVDMNQSVGNAMQLPEAISLAKQGRLDEAADIYSRITGMEHVDAIKAVQAMAGGHAVALTPGRPGASFQGFSSSYSTTPAVQISSPSTFSGETYTPPAKKRSGLSCFIIIGIVACLGILAATLAIGGPMLFGNSFNPLGTILFASQTMSFGSEGIGQGMFQNARAIGVDGKGNIVVADFKDGRVQTFDPKGKFLSSFTVTDEKGKGVNADSISVSQDGKIYIPNGKILIYDESGQQLGQIGDDSHFYENIAMGTDGTLYAITFGDNNLVHFKRDGSIDFEIPDPINAVTGSSGGFPKLAVDGLGNIYITNDTPPVILKFSPRGKYINQFGGEAKDAGQFEPGKFVSPGGIAIDGYGRIFVDDFYNIQVFDSSGAYLNNISGGYYGIAFDGQNNLYATSVGDHNVVKFQVQKPAGQ